MKNFLKYTFAFLFVALITTICSFSYQNNTISTTISNPILTETASTLTPTITVTSNGVSVENNTVTYGNAVALTANLNLEEGSYTSDNYVWQKITDNGTETLEQTTKEIVLYNVSESGKYIVTASVNGNTISGTSEEISVTINKADLTITASDTTATFGDYTQYTPTLSANVAFSDKVSANTGCAIHAFNYNNSNFSVGENLDVVYASKVNIVNSSTKTLETINWGDTSSDNYNITWQKGTLNIEPLPITPIVNNDLSKIYGDEDPTINTNVIIGQGVITQEITITLQISDRVTGENVKENGYLINSFSVKQAITTKNITYSEDNFTVVYTNTSDTRLLITPRTIEITEVTAKNREYNGTDVVSVTGKCANVAKRDAGIFNICSYATIEDINASSTPKPVIYYLEVCVPEIVDNYVFGILPEVHVTITPKLVNLKWTNTSSLQYNEQNQIPTVTISEKLVINGIPEEPEIVVNVAEPYADNHSIPGITYTAIASINSSNYAITSTTQSTTYQIQKAVINKDVVKNAIVFKSETITYDGQSHSLTHTNNAEKYVTFTGYENNELTNVGQKQVTANFEVNEYYALNTSATTLQLTANLCVLAKQLEIQWENTDNIIYNGQNQKPYAFVETGVLKPGSTTEYETLEINVTVNEPYQASHFDVGIYFATATLATETSNYILSTKNNVIQYEIQPAVIQSSVLTENVIFENKTVTYDGSTHTLNYSLKNELPDYIEFNVYFNNLITNVDSATVTIIFSTDFNHIFDNNKTYYDLSATLTVLPKEINVEWSNYENLFVTGINQKPTATANSGIQIPSTLENEVILIDVSVNEPNTLNHSSAGTYTATATTSNPNYKLLNNTIEYTIKNKSLEVSNNTNNNVAYIESSNGFEAGKTLLAEDVTTLVSDLNNLNTKTISESGKINKIINIALVEKNCQNYNLNETAVVKIYINDLQGHSNFHLAKLENNELKYVATTVQDGYLIFSTDSLGVYAIISDDPALIWPWIVAIIVLVAIIALFCYLLAIRKSATFFLDGKPVYIVAKFKGQKIKVPANLSEYTWYKDQQLKAISNLVMPNTNIELYATTSPVKKEIKLTQAEEFDPTKIEDEIEQPTEKTKPTKKPSQTKTKTKTSAAKKETTSKQANKKSGAKTQSTKTKPTKKVEAKKQATTKTKQEKVNAESKSKTTKSETKKTNKSTTTKKTQTKK